MEHLWHKKMKLNELRQPGWGDTADDFCERYMKYGTTALKVLAVVQPQTAYDAASSVPTTFSEPRETLDSIPGKLKMPQVTSQPGTSHMRLGLQKPQSHDRIPSLPPAPIPDWSQIQQSKHVGPVSFNPCLLRPKLIPIYKSDSDEDIVMAPASPEEWIHKLSFVTMYQFEMQYLYLFCYVSAFTWFQWPKCETW